MPKLFELKPCLFPRGEAGLCCDEGGVALGPVQLVEKSNAVPGKCYRICADEVFAKALMVAYGKPPSDRLMYLWEGIGRVRHTLEEGDVSLATMKATFLGLPEIEPENMAKLEAGEIEIASGEASRLAKFNPWHDLLGMFTDAADAVSDALVGTTNAGEVSQNPAADKKMRKINPKPGGANGPVIKFINDDPNKPSPDLPVSEETAKMVEDVVGASGLQSVTINSTTGGAHAVGSRHYDGKAVDIDMIDGYSVRNPRNMDKIKNLQDAFQEHANIHENFGPAYQLRTEINGTVIDKPKVAEDHKGHIHILGQR